MKDLRADYCDIETAQLTIPTVDPEANASTALYAWVNVGDATLAAINAFNAACCAVVLVLAAYKRAVWPAAVPWTAT